MDVQGPAPVHLWDPPFCGEMDMRIARDGTWFHQGAPIRRQSMVKLFASILRLDPDDCYYLVTPVEKVRITVDDCPFVATLLEARGSGREQELQFTTNIEETVVAGEAHQIRVTEDVETAEPHPVVHIRSGLNALINRNVFYRLVDLAETRDESSRTISGVWSGGQFFALGSFET
ncbi:MAG TPA: DUF1285 domain-containing protein [Gammaproteobacteria bacterium]|nr:DUF1285 domain-containing protein [Gammaproteobacteria bacterium]